MLEWLPVCIFHSQSTIFSEQLQCIYNKLCTVSNIIMTHQHITGHEKWTTTKSDNRSFIRLLLRAKVKVYSGPQYRDLM